VVAGPRNQRINKLKESGATFGVHLCLAKPRKIADGALDKKKQSALYVDVTKTDEIGLHPGLITRAEAQEEIERAKRLSDPLVSYSDEYRKLQEVLPAIFANLAKTDMSQN